MKLSATWKLTKTVLTCSPFALRGFCSASLKTYTKATKASIIATDDWADRPTVPSSHIWTTSSVSWLKLWTSVREQNASPAAGKHKLPLCIILSLNSSPIPSDERSRCTSTWVLRRAAAVFFQSTIKKKKKKSRKTDVFLRGIWISVTSEGRAHSPIILSVSLSVAVEPQPTE